MILLLHVLIALTSVGFTTLMFFSPTKAKLYTSYGLVAATLASGTYLVVSTQANLIHACITGLIYTGAVSVGIYAAQRKLATVKVRNK